MAHGGRVWTGEKDGGRKGSVWRFEGTTGILGRSVVMETLWCGCGVGGCGLVGVAMLHL